MCLLFLYVNNSAADDTTDDCNGYQVIIANNRDEYYTRPTQPATRWQHAQHCISGLDQQPGREGGTWMGLSEHGKVGILLNILQSCDPSMDKKGRGHLVTDYLTNTSTPEHYTAPLAADRMNYNPFHLILLQHRARQWGLHYFGSHDDSSPSQLDEGVSAWGNSHRATPWRKVDAGKQKFTEIVSDLHTTQQREPLVESLLDMLNTEHPHFPDPVLEGVANGYLSDEVTRQRSSIYVRSPSIQYGTRTNTVILIDGQGRGEYIERTLREPISTENLIWDTNSVHFNINNSS